MIVGKLVVLFILFISVYLLGYCRGYDDVTHISNWGTGWDSGYECGWKQGYAVSLCRRKDITGREMKRVYRIKRKNAPKEIIADEVAELPSVPAVPLDKLCELLAEMYHCPSSGWPSSGRACHPGCPDEAFEKLCGTDCDKHTDVERWKAFLTNWMEGLDAN